MFEKLAVFPVTARCCGLMWKGGKGVVPFPLTCLKIGQPLFRLKSLNIALK